ncbi:hypothetical protein [Neptunicella sp. SCSIO 80796]|uniref:hypothetical protein n=1 Tax=Neptunicella plasticusilytica TaxID=3117012 RepID=UPI003A4DC75E
MEAQFWQQKWQTGDIGFHETQANPLLTNHIAQLELAKGSRLFLLVSQKSKP